MKRLLLALLLVGALGLALAACVAVPAAQPDFQERALGGVTAVNVTSSGTITAVNIIASGTTTTTNLAVVTSAVVPTATILSANIGGGFGDTGCTVSSAGALSCDGAALLGSTLAVTGATSLTADVTLIAATGGGNQGAKTEYIGLPRIQLIGLSQGTNASLDAIYLDDSPTGECAPGDGSVSEAEGSVTSVYKFGASSYAAVWTVGAVANSGITCTIGSVTFETVENVGAWLYSSVAIAAGDLAINLVDDTAPVSYTVGALAANTWTWVEVDVTALDAGTGDAITGIGILLTGQGATNLGAFTLYVDRFAKFLTADSDTLGVAVIQDGVLSVINTETGAPLVEGTDYFARYISGNDAIIYMTNQSAADVVALVAY